MSRLWSAAVLAILWAVWLERNGRIFENIENKVEDLWEKIKFWVALGCIKLKVVLIYLFKISTESGVVFCFKILYLWLRNFDVLLYDLLL